MIESQTNKQKNQGKKKKKKEKEKKKTWRMRRTSDWIRGKKKKVLRKAEKSKIKIN